MEFGTGNEDLAVNIDKLPVCEIYRKYKTNKSLESIKKNGWNYVTKKKEKKERNKVNTYQKECENNNSD